MSTGLRSQNLQGKNANIMKAVEFIHPNSICADLVSSGKLDVLTEMGKLLANVSPGTPENLIIKALIERERLATTGIGQRVAIPHAKIENLDKITAAVGISRTGIQFDAVDGQPVHIFVALLAPQGSTGEHLKALARVSRLLKNDEFRQGILSAKTADEIYSAIIEEDGKY